MVERRRARAPNWRGAPDVDKEGGDNADVEVGAVAAVGEDAEDRGGNEPDNRPTWRCFRLWQMYGPTTMTAKTTLNATRVTVNEA